MRIFKNLIVVPFVAGFLIWETALSASKSAHAKPIYHEVHYPSGTGPFPVVIVLHTSIALKQLNEKYQIIRTQAMQSMRQIFSKNTKSRIVIALTPGQYLEKGLSVN